MLCLAVEQFCVPQQEAEQPCQQSQGPEQVEEEEGVARGQPQDLVHHLIAGRAWGQTLIITTSHTHTHTSNGENVL